MLPLPLTVPVLWLAAVWAASHPGTLENPVRDPKTDQLLTAVRQAVADARTGGVTARACIWDATTAAIDTDTRSWPSTEARRTADAACRAVEPPAAKANPTPSARPPLLARALYAAANRIATPKETR